MRCAEFRPGEYEQLLREDVKNLSRKADEPPKALEYYLHVGSCKECPKLFLLYLQTHVKQVNLKNINSGLAINRSFLEALTQ